MEDIFNSKTITRDFITMFLGQQLGHGVSRQVFVNDLDHTTVIKIEVGSGSFQNVIEAQFWDEIKAFKKMAKWFAPVVAISPCGTVLVQKRVSPTSLTDYPAKMPALFTDIKRDNFGMLNGQLVCFDYGLQRLSNGLSVKKMRKVDWAARDNI